MERYNEQMIGHDFEPNFSRTMTRGAEERDERLGKVRSLNLVGIFFFLFQNFQCLNLARVKQLCVPKGQ